MLFLSSFFCVRLCVTSLYEDFIRFILKRISTFYFFYISYFISHFCKYFTRAVIARESFLFILNFTFCTRFPPFNGGISISLKVTFLSILFYLPTSSYRRPIPTFVFDSFCVWSCICVENDNYNITDIVYYILCACVSLRLTGTPLLVCPPGAGRFPFLCILLTGWDFCIHNDTYTITTRKRDCDEI